MKLEDIKKVNEDLMTEIKSQMNKMVEKTDGSYEQELILQDKLVNLLLILRKENER